MRIKSSDIPFWGITSVEKDVQRGFAGLLTSRWRYVVYSVLLATFAVGCTWYGAELQRTERFWLDRSLLGHLRRSNLRTPIQWMQGLRARPEVLDISMKHMNYMKLAYLRARAWEYGKVMEETKAEYVAASIDHEGQSYRAKVRLKGFWLDHLQQDKWSLRVKLRDDRALLGMSRFSIQAPYTRNYIHEWLYQRALASQGLMALNYRFVKVRLNGRDLGIFAMEEHFDNVTCTRNERPEGFFFKPLASDVMVYQEEKLLADPKTRDQVQSLRTAYQNLLDGNLEAHRLFNAKLTARHLAVSELFAAGHSHILGNLVCYFNPATLLAEPVGYDANAGHRLRTVENLSVGAARQKNVVLRRLFDDPAISERYVAELGRLSTDWIRRLLRSIGPELQENLAIIYSNYPGFYFDTAYLKDNLRVITQALDGSEALRSLTYRHANGAMVVSGYLRSVLPMEVLGAYAGDQPLARPEEVAVVAPGPSTHFELKLACAGDPAAAARPKPTGTVRLWYRLLGKADSRWEAVMVPSPQDDRSLSQYIAESEQHLRTLPFVAIDERNRQVTIAAGVHVLDRTLVIPQQYRLRCAGGVTLDLTHGAMILSLGPVHLTGTPETPIVVTSSDATGQGFVVMDAVDRSVLENVVFEKQHSAHVGAWRPNGAVFFYQSPVTMDDCIVREMAAEDGLNIVRSDFEVTNCLFDRCDSDALDVDFGTGVIRNSAFLRCGNDAIDVSGSHVTVEQLVVDQAGDKGLSAGEHSEMKASRVDVRNSNIAVASKDLSTVNLTDSRVEGCQYGLAVYQKKPEFGPGRLRATRVDIVGTQTAHAVEAGATLNVDSRTIAPNIKAARQLFYGK